MQLKKSIAAWQTPDFNAVFKDEVKHQNPDLLPLQQGLVYSSSVSAANFDVIILHVDELPNDIRVKAGLFYSGIIAGCNCADDPSTANEINEYCEVRFEIDKRSGETTVALMLM